MDVVPSTVWRTLDERMVNKPLPRGLDAFWDAAVGMAVRLVPRQRRFLQQAEAVLALKLARGLSLAEISATQNISQHTSRAQLKSVFAKTGVSRQAELVRLVLKSVASLA